MAGERAEKALKEWQRQYKGARKKEKGTRINEVSRVTPYHRKCAALRQETVCVVRREH